MAYKRKAVIRFLCPWLGLLCLSGTMWGQTQTYTAGTGTLNLPFTRTLSLPKFNRPYARLNSTVLTGTVRGEREGQVTNNTSATHYPSMFMQVSGIFRYSDGFQFLSASPSDQTTVTANPGRTVYVPAFPIANPTKTLAAPEQNAYWVGAGNATITVSESVVSSFVSPGFLPSVLQPPRGEMQLRVQYTYQDVGLNQLDPITQFVPEAGTRFFGNLPSGRWIELGDATTFAITAKRDLVALTMPVDQGGPFSIFDVRGLPIGTALPGERFVLPEGINGVILQGYTEVPAVVKVETAGTSSVRVEPVGVR